MRQFVWSREARIGKSRNSITNSDSIIALQHSQMTFRRPVSHLFLLFRFLPLLRYQIRETTLFALPPQVLVQSVKGSTYYPAWEGLRHDWYFYGKPLFYLSIYDPLKPMRDVTGMVGKSIAHVSHTLELRLEAKKTWEFELQHRELKIWDNHPFASHLRSHCSFSFASFFHLRGFTSSKSPIVSEVDLWLHADAKAQKVPKILFMCTSRAAAALPAYQSSMSITPTTSDYVHYCFGFCEFVTHTAMMKTTCIDDNCWI